MKKTVLFSSVLFTLMSSAHAAEHHIEISGAVAATVPLRVEVSSKNSLLSSDSSQSVSKPIMLNKITLSPSAQDYLAKTLTAPRSLSIQSASIESKKLPTHVDLGMNKVPVLDQGQHGSCVTFSNTAALDAGYAHGDYISQLCNLELGEYLHEQDSTYPSGWEGSSGNRVLNQIETYGIVAKAYQESVGCAGVHDYPLDDTNNIGKPMPTADFSHHSEDLMKTIHSTSLLNYEEALSDNPSATQLLTTVKTALAGGHRVTFGVLLDTNEGGVGAFGSYKTAGDSWMITPKIVNDAKAHAIDAGHEMVVIGYDDNAVIIGPNNLKEKGAFKLRNSWSTRAGDQGDYYMSYNYFAALTIEAHKITAPSDRPVMR